MSKVSDNQFHAFKLGHCFLIFSSSILSRAISVLMIAAKLTLCSLNSFKCSFAYSSSISRSILSWKKSSVLFSMISHILWTQWLWLVLHHISLDYPSSSTCTLCKCSKKLAARLKAPKMRSKPHARNNMFQFLHRPELPKLMVPCYRIHRPKRQSSQVSHQVTYLGPLWYFGPQIPLFPCAHPRGPPFSCTWKPKASVSTLASLSGDWCQLHVLLWYLLLQR